MEYISLICPVLNEEKNISRFLDLILAQTYVPEIVFVDGGSTDNTVKLINLYQKKSNKIKLIQINEKGTGKAINVGSKNASGRYLAHVGVDFLFFGKNTFLKALQFIEKNQNINLFLLGFPLKKRFNNLIKDSFLFWDSRFSSLVYILLIKKEIFPSYPDIAYGEDKIVGKKLEPYLKNAKIYEVDEPFLRFEEEFSIKHFVARYLWYGRTFLPYLNLCKDPKEYLRIFICVLGVFFPPALIFPFLIGVYDSIKFLKSFPSTLIFFPIFSMAAAWLMGVGFLIGFFNKDLGH